MRRSSRIKRSLDHVTMLILTSHIEEEQSRPLRHDLVRPRSQIAIDDRMQALYDECASDPELARELGVA